MINLIKHRHISWSRLFTLIVLLMSLLAHTAPSSGSERLEVFQVDVNTKIFRLKIYEVEALTFIPEHRVPTGAKHWNTLSHLRGPYYDTLYAPGDLVITDQNKIIMADQLYIYEFDEPSKSTDVITPKSTELKKSPNYMWRRRDYMGLSASGGLFINNDAGIYRSRFFNGQLSKAVSLKAHANNLDHISDGMVIDNNKATVWFVDSGYLHSYSHGSKIEKAYEIHGVHGNKELSSIVGYGSSLYSVTSIKGEREKQQKLVVSASELNKRGRIHWDKTVEPVKVGNEKSPYACSPEIAVNSQRVFVLCNQEILILNRHNGETLFRKFVSTKPDEFLLGIVISDDGHLLVQGKYGIYSVSNDLVFTCFPYDDSELPARGMVITDSGQLLALSLINNGIEFVKQEALSSESSPERKQAAVIIRIFNINRDGSLSLNREEQPMYLQSPYAGGWKKAEGARPLWQIGAPTLSNSGNLYVALTSITGLKDGVTSGTDMMLEKKVGLRLSSTAPWPKRYRDHQNTNWVPAVEPDEPSHSAASKISSMLYFLPALSLLVLRVKLNR